MQHIYLYQYMPRCGPYVFIVYKLVNNAKYSIGQELTRAVVQSLCDQKVDPWHVEITEDKQ